MAPNGNVLSRFWSLLEIKTTPLKEALRFCDPITIFDVLRARDEPVNKYLRDLMSETRLWQLELFKFTTFRQPWNKNYAIPVCDLALQALEDNKFNCWAAMLSWCCCAKCGRKWPNPDTHDNFKGKQVWSCRSCDLPPNIMEKDQLSPNFLISI